VKPERQRAERLSSIKSNQSETASGKLSLWRGAGAAAIAMAIAGTVAWAGPSLQRFVVQRSELPKGWSFVKSYYSVSGTASDFYENYELSYAKEVGATVVAKEFQSFAGPARGTVFYLQFATAADAERAAEFARKLVWEGSGPSKAHPERILTAGANLAIISFANQGMSDELERLLKAKQGQPSS
jgi:hypothetical protein